MGITIGRMVDREVITPGVYLRQTAGEGMGLIAVVHRVGASVSGEWFFQVRYLNRPGGPKRGAVAEWSQSLREHALADFDLIGTWIAAQPLLVASPPSRKSKKEPILLTWKRGIPHPKQLRMFDDY